MKKNMIEYINSMSEGKLDTLGTIISLQYKKFIQFYKLVSEYSDDISKVSYQFNSSSSLDVGITFENKCNVDDISDNILNSMEKSKYDGNLTKIDKKNILMNIYLEEDAAS